MKCKKNIKKFWKQLKIVSKEFDNEPDYNEKYLKAKLNFITEKSTQIFTIIKYKKKIRNLFAYQEFCLILFSEQVKIIILKCF